MVTRLATRVENYVLENSWPPQNPSLILILKEDRKLYVQSVRTPQNKGAFASIMTHATHLLSATEEDIVVRLGCSS